LTSLGVYGHQPGIAAHVRISDDESLRIEEAILRQKVGCNAKTIKQYKEHADRRSDDNEARIRIRIAKLATRTIVKWKRYRKKRRGGGRGRR